MLGPLTRLSCFLLLLASTLFYILHTPRHTCFSTSSSSEALSLTNHNPSNHSSPLIHLHQPHPKRDHDLLNNFGCLVNKGIKYFEEGVIYAYEGFGDPPADWGPHPFDDNGWAIEDDEEGIPPAWDEVLKVITPPRGPKPDEYGKVRVTQEEEFDNAWGRDKE
ncbi:MAG: hypothetical protein Q9168_006398, partial [Polycauliona sp. 1 TL-2023]